MPYTVLSRIVRSLFGPTRKSSPWGNFSDGGLNQSIKRRLSLQTFGWLIDWKWVNFDLIGLLDSYRMICFYGGGANVTEHCGTMQYFYKRQEHVPLYKQRVLLHFSNDFVHAYVITENVQTYDGFWHGIWYRSWSAEVFFVTFNR